ncbi:MAG: OmpA family protein [Saprospirales bacterium]|nr:OmpA family protein [Saprospirales bacterium]MBK6901501.1 OmpA family protein [Saprospirales bacterium]MBK7336119.1 OmpA family protein [Saprospirales bacterium]
MNKYWNILRPLALLLALACFSAPAPAQQTTTKTKQSDKLYDKGEILVAPNVIIRNADPINTENLEFSPAFYQNGIVYVTSRRKGGAVDKKIGETFFELYYSDLDRKGFPMKPQEFSVNMNSTMHEGPVTFNRKGDVVYFTRNNEENGVQKADSKGVTRLKVYEGHKGEFDWEDVKELPFNNDEFSTMHPSLSPDGRRLYFSSDMPGGYGGFDLYFVEKRGESWSIPINMGPDINSQLNEVFPYIHESGVLFFSSNGHNSRGGLDIFMVNISTQTWGRVVNLGIPFNSPHDDLGFILDGDGEFGYFTSSRSGGKGKDDIYYFELPEGMEGINTGIELATQFIVYNEKGGQRIPGAAIRVLERSTDGLIKENEFYDIQLEPSPTNPDELIIKLKQKNPYEMGNPVLYTDDNGEGIYRLKTDKNYFIFVTKEGFKSSEKTYTTVGEAGSQVVRIPLSSTDCTVVNGIVTIENYNTPVPNATVRIYNNSTREESSLRANSDGEFEYCLPSGYEYTVYAEKEGFTRGINRISTVDLAPAQAQKLNINLLLNPLAENIMREPIKAGTIIVLENLYYDFNKSAIRTGEARELDALVKLMQQFPSMQIELTAHTDSRGSEDYNQELSEKRALSAREYLVEKGIQGARIKAFGMGESKLRNNCKDDVPCSEQEHQYNRRTEVRVSKIEEPVTVKYKSKEGDN